MITAVTRVTIINTLTDMADDRLESGPKSIKKDDHN
jgi:hypothetical protein